MHTSRFLKIWGYIFVPFGLLFAIRQLFGIEIGPPTTLFAFLYILIALFLPGIFLHYRFKKSIPKEQLPWYDLLLAIVSFAIPFLFFFNGERILSGSWEILAPPNFIALAIVIIVVLIEGARRVGGLALGIVITFFSVFPLFADKMPGILWGYGIPFDSLMSRHLFGPESVLSIPLTTVGRLLIGFYVFATALIKFGGGQFLVDLSMALVGHIRGGAAKVAVFGSGLTGMLSGSVIANIATTGTFTIPMMKKTGYSSHQAASVEACASSGGMIMPPVMGSVAFIMAEILQLSYALVCVAAFIPAVAYYLTLMLGVDARAVKSNLVGLPKRDLPKIGATLKQGWVYIIPFVVLVFVLLYLRQEGEAPFYAFGILLILLFALKKFKWAQFKSYLLETGILIAEVVVLLGAIGMIIGSLSLTGVAQSLTRDLLAVSGGNIILLLILGLVASFILGMGMSIAGVYIILALTVAPALIEAGVGPVGAHLFVIYTALLSFITPPVAIGSIVAAEIAGADMMKTSFLSMRLGFILYIVPFLFAFNPALLLQGSLEFIVMSVVCLLLGSFFLIGVSEGYILGFGKLNSFQRLLALIPTCLLFLPTAYTHLSIWLNLGGIILVAVLVVLKVITHSISKHKQAVSI